MNNAKEIRVGGMQPDFLSVGSVMSHKDKWVVFAYGKHVGDFDSLDDAHNALESAVERENSSVH